MSIAQALTIAGSDNCGGAGFQADLKTFQMQHVFGMTTITAIPVQNSMGVYAIHAVPLDIIEGQLKAIADDYHISAFKIGMLNNSETIECIANALKKYDFGKTVLDPVMYAKNGAPLLQPSAVEALRTHLVPMAEVITPNIPEAEALTGIHIVDDESAIQAAQVLQQMGTKNIVIKGGHTQDSQSEICRDWLITPTEILHLDSPRFYTRHTHGTGCTFSACIAAELAKGHDVVAAVKTAKAFITAAISHPLNIGHGNGPTNHWAYSQLNK
ncbi:bifunctional hydroxymethylpyrimidine kinase/phosphomethylpyrimidine kinase [Pasteurella oralis]|uniref:bifunctional hydroxymethylpyrimidine kinase/phosphomethylpyrimidine kinase n=1 Tax=Pasteurella oralis TaxID=1071947 RepID=UPI000C7BC828|nr:bifunctional hydroxymethylpyrimidine kinase/phosphomethylpyrimidine kinase [Pasteurella oralis]